MLNAEIRPKILSMSAATIERLHLRRFPASPARRRGYSTTTERRNPIGFVHGSYAATLLDTVMGCAVHSRMMIGQAYRRCLPPRGSQSGKEFRREGGCHDQSQHSVSQQARLTFRYELLPVERGRLGWRSADPDSTHRGALSTCSIAAAKMSD
jgi:hypothetical protein